MSYKDKFDEIIGIPFKFEDDQEYPDYVITVGAAGLMALIDLTKFDAVKKWEPFVPTQLPNKGHVWLNEQCFNARFIKKARQVLDPKMYGFYTAYNSDRKEYDTILALKNGDTGIIVAPAVPEKEKKEDEIELKETIKKPPSSVFVL